MTDNKGTSRRKRDLLTPHHCEIPGCGYDKIFQRHRIVPGRDGGRYKLGNVIALCPNHHGEADRGWIAVESLLAIVYERIIRDYGQEGLVQVLAGKAPALKEPSDGVDVLLTEMEIDSVTA